MKGNINNNNNSWREGLSEGERNQIIEKIILALKPFSNNNEEKLFSLAKNFEEKIYREASNKVQYHHLIASRIVSVKKRKSTEQQNPIASNITNNSQPIHNIRQVIPNQKYNFETISPNQLPTIIPNSNNSLNIVNNLQAGFQMNNFIQMAGVTHNQNNLQSIQSQNNILNNLIMSDSEKKYWEKHRSLSQHIKPLRAMIEQIERLLKTYNGQQENNLQAIKKKLEHMLNLLQETPQTKRDNFEDGYKILEGAERQIQHWLQQLISNKGSKQNPQMKSQSSHSGVTSNQPPLPNNPPVLVSSMTPGSSQILPQQNSNNIRNSNMFLSNNPMNIINSNTPQHFPNSSKPSTNTSEAFIKNSFNNSHDQEKVPIVQQKVNEQPEENPVQSIANKLSQLNQDPKDFASALNRSQDSKFFFNPNLQNSSYDYLFWWGSPEMKNPNSQQTNIIERTINSTEKSFCFGESEETLKRQKINNQSYISESKILQEIIQEIIRFSNLNQFKFFVDTETKTYVLERFNSNKVFLSLYVSLDIEPRLSFFDSYILPKITFKYDSMPKIVQFPTSLQLEIKRKIRDRGYKNFLNYYLSFLERSIFFSNELGDLDKKFKIFDTRFGNEAQIVFQCRMDTPIKLPPLQIELDLNYPKTSPRYIFDINFDLYLPGIKLKFDQKMRTIPQPQTFTSLLENWDALVNESLRETEMKL